MFEQYTDRRIINTACTFSCRLAVGHADRLSHLEQVVRDRSNLINLMMEGLPDHVDTEHKK
jgi:hypothetical protein